MWKLKKDAAGNVMYSPEGFPIYINEDGQEVAYDVNRLVKSAADLRKEAQTNREAKEALEVKVKAFGDLDPTVAREAVEKVQKIADKKLYESGDVDKLRAEISQAYQIKLDTSETERKTLEQKFNSRLLSDAFGRSDFITKKLAHHPDLIQPLFQNNFKVENGNLVGYDSNGNQIFSPANPGTLATFDEAVAVLVQNHPRRDDLMKSDQGGGSGNRGTPNATGGGKQTTYTRAQLEALAPHERSAVARSGAKIID